MSGYHTEDIQVGTFTKCKAKIHYHSRGEARDAACRLTKIYGTKMTPYRCAVHQCFHVGTWAKEEIRRGHRAC